MYETVMWCLHVSCQSSAPVCAGVWRGMPALPLMWRYFDRLDELTDGWQGEAGCVCKMQTHFKEVWHMSYYRGESNQCHGKDSGLGTTHIIRSHQQCFFICIQNYLAMVFQMILLARLSQCRVTFREMKKGTWESEESHLHCGDPINLH